MVTLKDATKALSQRLVGFYEGTIAVDPDITDILAKRSVLSSKLFNNETDLTKFEGKYIWVPRYKDQRRVSQSGYSTLLNIIFEPPTAGSYTLTFYGYGTTKLLAYSATASQIQVAIRAVHSSLDTVEVAAITGKNTKTIKMMGEEHVDMDSSAGTVLSQGGLARLEVTQGFTEALVAGDTFQVHTKLPVEPEDNLPGLHDLIREALRTVHVRDKFPLTPTESLGIQQTVFPTSTFSWLTDEEHIIALYLPTEHKLVSTFTPPASGTFTLTMQLASAYGPTSAISVAGLTGLIIQNALQAIVGLESITVTPLTSGTTYQITLPTTRYATPQIVVSAGTVVNVRTMLYAPERAPLSWRFDFDGEVPYLNAGGFSPNESFYVEALRPAHTWVAPQTNYQTLGTVWGDSTTGPLNDLDQINVDILDLTTISYAMATEAMRNLGPQNETEYWAGLAHKAAQALAYLKFYKLRVKRHPGRARRRHSTWGTKGFW